MTAARRRIRAFFLAPLFAATANHALCPTPIGFTDAGQIPTGRPEDLSISFVIGNIVNHIGIRVIQAAALATTQPEQNQAAQSRQQHDAEHSVAHVEPPVRKHLQKWLSAATSFNLDEFAESNSFAAMAENR